MDSYEKYKKALDGLSYPLAILDLDLLDINIEAILERAKKIPIRIATKSIRSRYVLDYILTKAPDRFSGLMAYSVPEAQWLIECGFKNILLAYPYINLSHLQLSEAFFKDVTFMVDRVEHLESLDKVSQKYKMPIKVCLDLDLSVKFPGLYFGVYRSSLKNLDDVKSIIGILKNFPLLKFTSLMGYEAQIAGVGEKNPYKKLLTNPIRLLKKISINKIRLKRKLIVDYLKTEGFSLEFVNGGGTGSIETTKEESSVTEVAVGSGFYSPLLFDYYDLFKHEPALFFALEVTRLSSQNVYTLAGGGYVASGSAGEDKLPRPYLPENCELISQEGVGEVQTPIITGQHFNLGDPVFFRHAKAGELLERFNDFVLIRNGKVIGIEKSYRGEGKCFL